VDGTVGAGGHAAGLLQASAPDGRLLGLDLDPQALALAAGRLAPFGDRAALRQASYLTLPAQLLSWGVRAVDGILLDLGVSSMQLDTASRGFSFRQDAPLDMRFSPDAPETAADLVNTLSERELASLIAEYGEDRYARRIARAIVRARPLHTTHALAQVIVRATPGAPHKQRIHPATRTFQALRIAVNQELQTIQAALPLAVQALNPGGRLAVIAFHSLEDRIVKHFLRRESKDCICSAEQPVCTCDHQAAIKVITRKPLVASSEEIAQNPRARSARLRVAERLPTILPFS